MSASESGRRDFLRTAGAAVATSAVGRRILGANDRVSVGFIGVGVMGSENLRAAMDKGAVAGAVCDVYQPNLERAAARARRAGQNPKEVTDFREVLADPSIDAICISTPDHWHPYITVEGCKAGKDVYVEKPACVTLNDGFAMIKAARKYDRIVQAGTWQRSGEHFQRACEMVRDGTLGDVTLCRTWIYEKAPREGIGRPPDGPVPAGLDWDLWQGPAPDRPFNPNRFGVYPKQYSKFRFYWDYAGGKLTDSGIHMLDIVHMAMGEKIPQSASSLGGKYWHTDDTETPDTMQATFEYDDYIASWVHCSNNTGNQDARLMGAQFHGSRGTLYVDRRRYQLTPEEGSGLEAHEMDRVTDPHPLHWVNFLDCVKTRKRPNSDIETCVYTSAACILGNLSLRVGMRLDWDDDKRVTLQHEAWPYLDRKARSPWEIDV